VAGCGCQSHRRNDPGSHAADTWDPGRLRPGVVLRSDRRVSRCHPSAGRLRAAEFILSFLSKPKKGPTVHRCARDPQTGEAS
jgi:hypothetical protein